MKSVIASVKPAKSVKNAMHQKGCTTVAAISAKTVEQKPKGSCFSMNDLIKFRMGQPFDCPGTPEELETIIQWFPAEIKTYITEKNLVVKYQNMCQILKILITASSNIGVDIDFSYNYETKELRIDRVGSKQDILNLPVLYKEFITLYRFEAHKYRCPE